MSIIKFELKEEHLKLLKYLRWSITKNGFLIGTEDEEDLIPFGEDSLYNAINIILNGKPEIFDPLNTDELEQYSNEQKKEWDNLYSELPKALNIVLYTGSFELGMYKSKFSDGVWKKIK